jgi:protein gp37
MGESWGTWKGCSPVSPGCGNCYSLFRVIPRWYGLKPGQVTVNKDFRKPYRWKTPQMIFVTPLSDFFIDHPVADKWRPAAWSVMSNTPRHTYRICTKRPENIARMLPPDWPLPNVWLGVSAENQHWADVRMEMLRSVPIHPKAIRWVSAEPLLGPIRFVGPSSLNGYGWVIDGGESGDSKHPPRRANLDWFRSIRDQCAAAGVPFCHKQHGAASKCRCWRTTHPPGDPLFHEKAFGCRILDGRLHDDIPPW